MSKKQKDTCESGCLMVYCHHEKELIPCGDCWPCAECEPCAYCDKWPCPYSDEGGDAS